MSPIVETGIDRVRRAWPRHLRDARTGLLLHPASVTRSLVHSADVFLGSRKFRVSALFGPQHGIRGETQDNMIEWEGFRDPGSGLPVYSLYGRARKPSASMLRSIDVLAIDLQDVGSRYYTFIWTLALCLEACRQSGKAVVVLDRPNPIGGHLLEGPVLLPAYRSFVGLQPLPVRHGMTIGEISLYLRDHFYPEISLDVIRMRGWKRRMWFDETGLPWVMPSPNMPTLDTAAVYPGMCLFEGTNLSEGRGTTRPFEIFGAPFIVPDELVRKMREFRLPGVFFRPLHFIPTFHKYSGRLCGGAQIHILDREKFRPFRTAVALLRAIFDLYPSEFQWKQPPYEYEETLLPIDILAGTDRLRKDIMGGVPLKNMSQWWEEELEMFRETRGRYLLY